MNFDVSVHVFVYFNTSDPLRQIHTNSTSYNAALFTSTTWNITADGLNAAVVCNCKLKTQRSQVLTLMMARQVFFRGASAAMLITLLLILLGASDKSNGGVKQLLTDGCSV